MKPWTQKYIPADIAGIVGQPKVAELRAFVEGYRTARKRSLILYGPPGSGKTSSVHAVAKELGLEILEINASDARDKASIESLVGAASGQMSLFSKGKIILIDEVDGVSGTSDRGGLSSLASLIDRSSFPIVMTANDPYDQKFSSLRKKAELLEFAALDTKDVKEVLKRICYAEGINYDDMALSALARRTGGDLRGAITDLQSLSGGTKRLRMEDVDELSDRRRTESMASALVKVLKTTRPEIALTAFEDVKEDVDEVFFWLDENMPKEYTRPEDLARAYDAISTADLFRGRIRRWQHWRFLSYIYDLLTAGVAVAKDEKQKAFVKYMPTMRLLRIWQVNMKIQKKKSIASKIAEKTHTSIKRAMKDSYPYLKQLIAADGEAARRMVAELDLSKEEIDYLNK